MSAGDKPKSKPMSPQRQRELFTLAGFAFFEAGVCGLFGPCVAMVIGGGIVFALGIYGLSR